MRIFESLVKKFAYLLAGLAALSLVLMMLQTVMDVILNNVINKPIEGNLEVISIYHMVIIVFLPLALVELRHEHINSDLLVINFSKFWRRFTSLIDALQSFEINEVVMGSIYVPVWPARFALPLGFSAFMLVVLLHIIHAFTKPDFDPTPSSPDSDKDTSVSI
jgi:TRAP-type C4-dicarboxylate transport system permease small subunit